MILAWFRVHEVVLNDPGRLIAVEIMHFSNICDWSGSMAVYESTEFDPSDAIFNPMWRQVGLKLPFMDPLGVTSSWGTWNIEGVSSFKWSGGFEVIAISHSCLSGCLFAAAIWHSVNWWNCASRRIGQSAIDVSKLFGIHLALLGFGVSDVHGWPMQSCI